MARKQTPPTAAAAAIADAEEIPFEPVEKLEETPSTGGPAPAESKVETSRTSRSAASTAIARRLDAAGMLERAIDNKADVATIERLVGLVRETQEWQAKNAWVAAMVEFQRECPKIFKTKLGDTGAFQWTYAPIDEIMRTILPVMAPLGLNVTYPLCRELTTDKQVAYFCRIAHEAGHSEDFGPVVMPIEPPRPDGKGANAMQRVGISHAYAKRAALWAGLGMTAEEDPDGVVRTAPPKVRMPERTKPADASTPPAEPKKNALSESSNPRATAAASSSAAMPQGASGAWAGIITEVEIVNSKPGMPRHPWKLYKIKTGDGQTFGTFDPKLGDLAAACQRTPQQVGITFRANAKGNREVVELRIVE